MVKLSEQLIGLKSRTERQREEEIRRRRREEEIRRRRKPSPPIEKTPLEQEIEREEKEVENLRKDLKLINDAIEEKQRKNPEYSGRHDRNRARIVAEEIDQKVVRLNILRDSQSLGEASRRESLYKRQVQESIARSKEEGERRKAEKKIRELEEKGYKPFVVEKSEKGKLKGVELLYYSAEKDDMQLIKTFPERPPIDVSKAEFYGYSQPQERKIAIAGKEITFQARVPIYKEVTGEIITPYGKTGFTEKQLIEQQKEQAYEEFKKTQDPLYIPPSKKHIILTAEKDLPFGYGGQQTISDQPITATLTAEQYYDQQTKEKIDLGMSKVFGGIKKGWDYVDKRVHWDIPRSIRDVNIGFIPLSFISIGKKDQPTIPETYFKKGSEKLESASEKLEEWVIGKEKIEEFETEVEEKYKGEYQEAFEQRYMKGLIYEEISFEEASKEFKESKEAKILTQQYQKEFGEGYKQLQTDVPFWKGTAGGVGQIGISLGELGIKGVKTPTRTITTGALVYTGVKGLRAIPPVISTATTTGLFAYGTYKFVSPKSTYIERGGGLITALITGVTLGYGAYRYLRSPVVKTVKIKPDIKTVKGKVVGYEQPKIVRTDIYGKTTIQEVTKYPKTISRQVIAGRRTIVTTKGRELTRAFWHKFGVDPKFTENYIYRGIPTEQLGRTYTIESLRGTYTYKTPSGYQKALKKLIDYKYTPAQAKATLRYYAPKVIETEISGINVLTYGEEIKTFARAKTTVITRQPKYWLDDELGISTRGAKTIKDIYESQKVIVGTKGDYTILREASTKTTGFLTKKGGWYNKIIQAGKTRTVYERGILAKASDIKTGIAGKELKDFIIGKEYKYQTIQEYFAQRQIIPKKLKYLYGKGDVKLIKSGEVVYIDERELTGISAEKVRVQPPPPKFTPIEKMSDIQLKEMIKDLQKIYGKPIKTLPPKIYPKKIVNVQQVVDKIETTKGISSQELKGLHQLPDIKGVKLKDLIKVKVDVSTGLKVGQASALALATGLKSDVRLKKDLKVDQTLKNLLKQETEIKTIQDVAPKTATTLKSQLKTLIDLKPITPTPTRLLPPKIPIIPRVPTYIPKPFIIPFLKAEVREKARKGKQKALYDLAYLPDFTARSLGLTPEIISEKEAKKKLKKLLTGLEIRRAVKIK